MNQLLFNKNFTVLCKRGGTVVQWLSLSGFEPTGQPSCVEFACSPRVVPCVGFLRVLRLPPAVQKHAGECEREWFVCLYMSAL